MGLSMRKALLAALTLVAMTSVVIVRTMRLSPERQNLEQLDQGRCLNYMEQCLPWENSCCNGMTCTNYRKGFCMHGLEACICQLPFDVRDGS